VTWPRVISFWSLCAAAGFAVVWWLLSRNVGAAVARVFDNN
jgi:hypothetical protein